MKSSPIYYYIMLWMDKKTGEKLADNRQDWK
jgi:hypothetical protein